MTWNVMSRRHLFGAGACALTGNGEPAGLGKCQRIGRGELSEPGDHP
jgi:hypothetical protein